jgi:hypothetical protein
VPEGTRIVDMNNKDITTITTSSADSGYSGQFSTTGQLLWWNIEYSFS